MSKQLAKQGNNLEQNTRFAIRLLLSRLDDAPKPQPTDQGVRIGKVAAIRDSLAAGRYKIPSAQVADKIIESLLRAKRQIREEADARRRS